MHGKRDEYYHTYRAHVCSVLMGYHVDPIPIPVSHGCSPPRLPSAPVPLINPNQGVHFHQYISLLHSAVAPPSPFPGIARVNMLIPFYELRRSPLSNTYICSTIIRPFFAIKNSTPLSVAQAKPENLCSE